MRHIDIYKYRSTSKKCHIYDSLHSPDFLKDLCGTCNYYDVYSFTWLEIPSIETIEKKLSVDYTDYKLCKICKLIYLMNFLSD